MLSSLFTLCLAAAATASSLPQAPPALKVTVSTPADVENIENLYAVVQMSNIGEDVVEINTFDTAFSSLDTNDFRFDGSAASGQVSEPAFVGVFARYVTEPSAVREAGGLLRLAAGESKSINTTLAARYDFTESGAGTYSIGTPAQFSVLVGGATEFETVTAVVEPATFNLQGTLVSKRNTRKTAKRAATYLTCTPAQETAIAAAAAFAQTGAVKAASSLAATSPAYITWFGAWDPARSTTVLNVFSKMNGLFSTINYDCGTCTVPGTTAYVKSNQPTDIFLCPVFWTAPTLSVESKAQILVGRVTQWPHVGLVNDMVYSEPESQALAISSPEQAVENASNYAYYFGAVNV